MAYELIYTSVPQGIKSGSSGFCTVAYTQGLAANIALKLESMSAYKPYFPHYDVNANNNPVSYCHHTAVISGETLHFISRVSFYGLDYTKRSNKLAHHCVLRSNEISSLAAGPAAVCELKDFFITEWNQPPQLFLRQKELSSPVNIFGRASTWEAYSGDAGWAGKLAQHYLDNSGSKPAYIIYDPLKHPNILHLVYEALMLIPENKRWEVTFNTYFMSLPAGMNCHWRFCTPDAESLKNIQRMPGNFIIDLTAALPSAGDGKLEDAARTGRPVCNNPVVEPEKKNEQSFVKPPYRVNNSPAFRQPVGRVLYDNSYYRTSNTAVPFQEKSSKNILLYVILGICLLATVIITAAVFVYSKMLDVPEDIEKPIETQTKQQKPNSGKKTNGKQRNRVADGVDEAANKMAAHNATLNTGAGKFDQIAFDSNSPKSEAASGSFIRGANPDGKTLGKKKDEQGKQGRNPQAGPDEIDIKRRSLFIDAKKINDALAKEKGYYTIDKILRSGEKISELTIKYKDGKSKTEPFKVKNGQVNGPEVVVDVIENKKGNLFAFALKCRDNGNVVLEQNNKYFDPQVKPEIIEFKTTKNEIISLKFNNEKSIWPKDRKDGKIRIDTSKNELSYSPTTLDIYIGWWNTTLKGADILLTTKEGEELEFKHSQGTYWVYGESEELFTEGKELEKFKESFKKLWEKNKKIFEDLVDKKTKKEHKEEIYCHISLKKIKDSLEQSKKFKEKKEIKEFFKENKLFEKDSTLKALLDENSKKKEEFQKMLEKAVANPKQIRFVRYKKTLKYMGIEK